ncbi:hypothetical protein KEJ34_08740 [Candidatus Bathyarchaeota archaeon]|nr:hypothetical protein [Candidatus Bathyarchaeota archaeon]
MEKSKIIYLILGILIAVPYIRPVGIPLPIKKMTLDFYNTLESLPEGSVVVLCLEQGMGMWVELGPASIAIMQHLPIYP